MTHMMAEGLGDLPTETRPKTPDDERAEAIGKSIWYGCILIVVAFVVAAFIVR